MDVGSESGVQGEAASDACRDTSDACRDASDACRDASETAVSVVAWRKCLAQRCGGQSSTAPPPGGGRWEDQPGA